MVLEWLHTLIPGQLGLQCFYKSHTLPNSYRIKLGRGVASEVTPLRLWILHNFLLVFSSLCRLHWRALLLLLPCARFCMPASEVSIIPATLKRASSWVGGTLLLHVVATHGLFYNVKINVRVMINQHLNKAMMAVLTGLSQWGVCFLVHKNTYISTS